MQSGAAARYDAVQHNGFGATQGPLRKDLEFKEMKRPANYTVSEVSVRARDLRNEVLARLISSANVAVARRVRDVLHASTRRTEFRKG